jgi:hypothetical protein
LGAILAILAPTLLEWMSYPTELSVARIGWPAWILSALMLAGITWSARDFFAWRRLRWGAKYPAV